MNTARIGDRQRTARSVLAVALLVAVAVPGPARAATEDPKSELPGASIEGTVRSPGADAAFPVRGAVVHAYEIATGKLRSSEVVSDNGAFRLEGLPHGWYEIAVEVELDGATYVGSHAIDLAPGERRALDLRVARTAPDAEPRRFAGTGRAGLGIAYIEERPTAKEFWFGPKGLAILGGAGAAVLVGAAVASGNDEPLASPSNP